MVVTGILWTLIDLGYGASLKAELPGHSGGPFRLAVSRPLVFGAGLRFRPVGRARLASDLFPRGIGGPDLFFGGRLPVPAAAGAGPVLLLDQGMADGPVDDRPGVPDRRALLDGRRFSSFMPSRDRPCVDTRFFLGILAAAAVSVSRPVHVADARAQRRGHYRPDGKAHPARGSLFPSICMASLTTPGPPGRLTWPPIPFAIFGVGVIPLKSCMVVLSLACLVLFYGMANRLYGRRTAGLASLALPCRLRWSSGISRSAGIPGTSCPFRILVSLFWSIDSLASSETQKGRAAKTFLFGLVSGLCVWCLELVLRARRRPVVPAGGAAELAARDVAVGLLGLVAGYGPAIVFNLVHRFRNWEEVFLSKRRAAACGRRLVSGDACGKILFQEMPKFFGPDTVLWYYPEKPPSGYVFYAIAWRRSGLAVFAFPEGARENSPGMLAGGSSDEDKDLLMLVLTLACFVPYLIAACASPRLFSRRLFLSFRFSRDACSPAVSRLPRCPVRLVGGRPPRRAAAACRRRRSH